MDKDFLLWSAGRDLALLRRFANPMVAQTETFNSTTLVRKLFLEGGIHQYWKHLRHDDSEKFHIEYTSIKEKAIVNGSPHLLMLTADQWSDLLVGGYSGTGDGLQDAHKGMTTGPLNNHISRSIVLAHERFQFTPEDIIKYHAYVLGDVHLGAKEVKRVAEYDKLMRNAGERYPIWFGSNGPASLALKGVVNRVVRSVAFKQMYATLEASGHIPDDVEFPIIPLEGLKEELDKAGFDGGMLSLQWTARAMEKRMHEMLRFSAA